MESVQLSELRPYSRLNLDGEIISKEQAEKIIAAGEQPILYTISNEFIQGALAATYEEVKSGQELSDVYSAPDPGAKRVLY